MKITFSAIILLLAFACTNKPVPSDEWPGMDSFHDVMASAYHPMKDSATLKPAKTLAEGMALEAEKWSNDELPEKVNNEQVKAMLAQLKTDTRLFADQVKQQVPDSVLSAGLENLHNEFHAIMEAWYKGGEEHKHH